MAHSQSESKASISHHETWGTANGTFVNRKKRSLGVSSKDPYLLTSEYNELDEVENGKKNSVGRNGTTTTIHSELNDPTILQTVKSLHGSPETNAIVSRSIQVESHSRTAEDDRILPQPVYFR